MSMKFLGSHGESAGRALIMIMTVAVVCSFPMLDGLISNDQH